MCFGECFNSYSSVKNDRFDGHCRLSCRVTVVVILLFSKFTKNSRIQMIYCLLQVVTGLLRKCGEVSRQIVTGGDSKDF